MLLWNRDLVIEGRRHRLYAAVVKSDGRWLLRQGGFGKVNETDLSENEARALLDTDPSLATISLSLVAFNSPTLIDILDHDDSRYDALAS